MLLTPGKVLRLVGTFLYELNALTEHTYDRVRNFLLLFVWSCALLLFLCFIELSPDTFHISDNSNDIEILLKTTDFKLLEVLYEFTWQD